MGTGKTTVGRLLAEQLGFEFVDTDVVIEERHGPIKDIFADHGEESFRAIERTVAAELAEHERVVISTGGRMMLDPANVAALGQNGRIFCLVATPETTLERVMSDASRIERPLLAVKDPLQRIVDLLAERAAGYRQFTQVDTDGKAPEVVAEELVTLVQTEPG